MDFNRFLEKDILDYLENAMKFGTPQAGDATHDADPLLAKKGELGADNQQGDATLPAQNVTIQATTVQTQAPSPQPTPPKPQPEPLPPLPAEDDAWFDELESQLTQTRLELNNIIDLEDSLNDIHTAIEQHDFDKANALFDHILDETNAISFHPQEKIFLFGELKQLEKALGAHRKLSKDHHSLLDDSKKSALVSVQSSKQSLGVPSFKKDKPFSIPPPFSKDEPAMITDYVAGVQAIKNMDKTRALRIFLDLIKKRPYNLAIKIRLQEAIELP